MVVSTLDGLLVGVTPWKSRHKMRKYLSLALCMLLPFSMVACTKKVEKKTESVAVAAVDPDDLTQDAMLSAMLRGHPNSKQICVDGTRNHAFFLDYGPLLKYGEPADGQWHGWIFIQDVEFYKTSNNTWFIIDQAANKYIQSYPDVNGLVCRQRL
jgi:hypothetical protein